MSGEHEHPELAHSHPYAPEAHGHSGYATTAMVDALDARLRALEPPAFTADRHVSPTGDDTADGLTRRTAWRTLGRAFAVAGAPAGASVALWDGGIIEGAALYDRALRLVTHPGVEAVVQGAGRYSLRLQRAHGSAIVPGLGGRVHVIAPRTIVEPPAADGTDPGSVRQAAVEITDCTDLDVTLAVTAGTDFGISVLNGLRNRVTGDVTDAGHGFHLKGTLGTGQDRSWFGGWAHDLHRMIRNTVASSDDYGAVGFVFENSTGGGLAEGWAASECWAMSRDYRADGGAIEGYDATDVVVMPGTATRCEGGFETGGSSGKGCARWDVRGLTLRGDFGPGTGLLGEAPRSPGVLLRSMADSTVVLDADITRALDVLRFSQGGSFGGSLSGLKVSGRIVTRPGINAIVGANLIPADALTVQLVAA